MRIVLAKLGVTQPKLTPSNGLSISFQKGFKKEEGAPEKRTRSAADIRAGRYKSGGKVSSASSRADGIAQRGKTKGRIC